MHVGIHEAGHQRRTADIEYFESISLAPTHHCAIGDHQAGVHPLPGSGGQNAATPDEEICWLVAARHRQGSKRNRRSCHGETLLHAPKPPTG
jgi:hypothetical protein